MVIVVLVLITLGAALVVGYVRGGRLRRLAELRPRRVRLLLTAFVLAVTGVAAGWVSPTAATILWSLTLLTVAWFCWLNRAVHGAGLVAAGLAVNAVAELGRLMADPPGVLTILGDEIPVALPWTVERVGAGDVLIAAGLAALIATSMAGANTPVVANAVVDETLAVSDLQTDEEHAHGQAQPQAQGPEEERREPREAPQQLSRFPA